MQRLPELQARIRSLAELGDIVGALRAVSAARVQQSHAVLDSIREHTEIIWEALGEAMRMSPAPSGGSSMPPGASVVIAIGSEHGFVGAFNDRVLHVAASERRPEGELYVVGARAALVASERHDPVSWSCQMATQVGGVDDVALRLAERLSVAGGERRVDRVTLIYTRITNGSAARVVTETLLPFDVKPHEAKRPERPPAVSHLSPLALIEGLVDELLFARLAHAAIESFASENAARLAAMQAATDNVAAKLDELGRLERELRQEEITTELLDIVTGAEAVIGAG
jgi:F-type H+-transporting ATPase subunit gamma